MINDLLEAIGMMDPVIIGFIIVGVLIGAVFGAIPGLGGVVAMSLILPMTIYLEGFQAIVILVAIYSGAMYGACISAILLKVPGSAAAAASIFDGYPLTQQGMAKDALGIGAFSSALGGLFSIVLLMVLAPYMYDVVLMFGSPHVFLLAMLGIAMIAVIARQGSTLKGLVAGSLGLLVTTVGIAPGSPTPRYTFDLIHLWDGLSLIAIVLGIFAIGEMIRLGAKGTIVEPGTDANSGSVLNGIKVSVNSSVTLIKSSLIGMIMGAIPGAGASSSNFIAYTEEVRSSKNPESYGKGNPAGLVAAESANNATVAGSLIPLLSFGIPGSAATAIVLSAFLIHGISPGPALFNDDVSFTFAILVALFISNLVILFVGLLLVTRIGARIVAIDINVIIPLIIMFAILGSYAARQNWIDIVTVVLFGFLSYWMVTYGYSVIGFVLGVVLGEIAEINLRTSLLVSDDLSIFYSDMLSAFLLASVLIVLLAEPAITAFWQLCDYLGIDVKERMKNI